MMDYTKTKRKKKIKKMKELNTENMRYFYICIFHTAGVFVCELTVGLVRKSGLIKEPSILFHVNLSISISLSFSLSGFVCDPTKHLYCRIRC